MKAPGQGMLKVSSILLIIFGAIGVFFMAITLSCALAAASLVSGMVAEISTELATAAAASITATAVVGLILGIIGSVAELVSGIMGMKRYADPAQGNFFIVAGIVMCAIQFVSMILSFNVVSLIGFVLPILFIIGGVQNKNAAAAPAAPVA
jgi:hypothetical protein